jgi:hypothetical protein
MPHLLLLCPCEKAIVDRNGALSLISIMGKLTVGVPANVPPPPANAALPMQWAIVTLWQAISDFEFGRSFEQRAALVSESGDTIIETLATFEFKKDTPNDSLAQIIAQISGMPLSGLGNGKIKVWIRQKAEQAKEWKESGSFPFRLELQPVSPPPDALS